MVPARAVAGGQAHPPLMWADRVGVVVEGPQLPVEVGLSRRSVQVGRDDHQGEAAGRHGPVLAGPAGSLEYKKKYEYDYI